KAEDVLPDSAWDRLGQYEVELQRVGVPEARQIVQARLQPFQEPFLSLEAVKTLVQKDYLFPLGEAWAQEFFAGKVDVRPRDVINWAREGWRRQQTTLQQLGGPAWLRDWEAGKAKEVDIIELSAEEIQKRIDEKVDLK